VLATTDGSAHRAERDQHQADDEHDDPDAPQDRDLDDKADINRMTPRVIMRFLTFDTGGSESHPTVLRCSSSP